MNIKSHTFNINKISLDQKTILLINNGCHRKQNDHSPIFDLAGEHDVQVYSIGYNIRYKEGDIKGFISSNGNHKQIPFIIFDIADINSIFPCSYPAFSLKLLKEVKHTYVIPTVALVDSYKGSGALRCAGFSDVLVNPVEQRTFDELVAKYPLNLKNP